MSSQKSSGDVAVVAAALAPKRARGRARVEAILDAGAAVFAEKGFDAATMSEIAARASTAIGSLYRFFPTKEVLADALVQRYRDGLDARLAAAAGQAGKAGPTAIAAALADAMSEQHVDRAAALELIEARLGMGERRREMREHVRRSVAGILQLSAPSLGADRAMVVAAVVVQMLKSLRALEDEPAPRRAAAIAEMRSALGLYLASRLT